MQNNPDQIPTWDEFLKPLLELAGEGPIMRRTSVQKIAEKYAFSEEIRSSRTKSGQTHICNRSGWAMSALVKAKFIEKIAKELVYLERSKPADRKKLKIQKFKEQNGLCTICGEALPTSGAELDRKEAIKGYTPENTHLDRAYRIGQTRDVQVYLPMLEHPARDITTFDTGLDRLISQKKRLAGSLGLIPIQPVNIDELVESVIKGAANSGEISSPVYLNVQAACGLSWDLFEALIAEIYDRESDRVILTSRGRDHGTDVVVIGHEGGENVLIQVKTTRSAKLDSEEAIREVEGSLRYFESTLALKFTRKSLHTNVRGFSRRTKKAADIYNVQLAGEDWLRKAIERHQIRLSDVLARNAQRQSV